MQTMDMKGRSFPVPAATHCKAMFVATASNIYVCPMRSRGSRASPVDSVFGHHRKGNGDFLQPNVLMMPVFCNDSSSMILFALLLVNKTLH